MINVRRKNMRVHFTAGIICYVYILLLRCTKRNVLRTFKLLPNVVQYINITYYTSVKVSIFLRLNFISGRDTGDKTGVAHLIAYVKRHMPQSVLRHVPKKGRIIFCPMNRKFGKSSFVMV